MTVTALGSGTAIGWMNIPRADAVPAAAPAPAQVIRLASATEPDPSILRELQQSRPKQAPAPTTTVAPAPKPSGQPIAESTAIASALQTRSTTPATANLAGPDSCSAALAYLEANSAPGFQFECPGYALGHQAMTCINVSGVCPGVSLIVINRVCPASYMNEAHNSWVMSGLATGSIDPYGYCH